MLYGYYPLNVWGPWWYICGLVWKPGGAWSGSGGAVVWGPCGGTIAVLCISSGAAVERPLMKPCMRMFDCWNS